MPKADSATINNHAAFIWSVADLLRGDYKASDYGKVILPLTVLRRLDCVLESTKAKVLAKYAQMGDKGSTDKFLRHITGQSFYNTHASTLTELLDDPDNLDSSLIAHIGSFSKEARDILDKFDFQVHIARLQRSDLLYKVLGKFCEIDLHPETVSNHEMGYLYEELIRRFSELSNETAGEHFTPREVIRLMVDLLFLGESDTLTKRGIQRTIFDPACGTGGMLSAAQERMAELNSSGQLLAFGQELNPETYAICQSDMLLKSGPDHDPSHIRFGNSFNDDGHDGRTFDYLLANPPFGVEWKKVEDDVKKEHASKGFGGRFGAGLPRINDGSFLFLQHMISKMKKPEEGGSRLAIVFNGSPLFTGGAGSGESEIRRWIIESDLLEAVVALPDQLFYNTGISTYFWVLTNRKSPERKGKVQLVDARDSFKKMRKSLGEKRKEISTEQIDDIVRIYDSPASTNNERVKFFDNNSFGFMRITVERPLRVRFDVSAETLSLVEIAKPLAKLELHTQEQMMDSLRSLEGLSETDRSAAEAKINPILDAAKLTAAQKKAVWSALMVRDENAPIVVGKGGKPEADPELRDYENVPLPDVPLTFEADVTARLQTDKFRQAIDEYVEQEIKPYVADAWVDYDKTKIGYEIPLTRHFYKYVPPRPLEEIDAEIKQLEREIQELLNEVTEG